MPHESCCAISAADSRSSADRSASTVTPAFARVAECRLSISPRRSCVGSIPSSWDFIQLSQGRGGVSGEDQLQEPANSSAVCKAQHVPDLLGGYGSCPMGDGLVEDRQTVAGRAFSGAGDHPQRLGLDVDAFRLRDLGEMFGKLLRRDAPEVETLAARQAR